MLPLHSRYLCVCHRNLPLRFDFSPLVLPRAGGEPFSHPPPARIKNLRRLPHEANSASCSVCPGRTTVTPAARRRAAAFSSRSCSRCA